MLGEQQPRPGEPTHGLLHRRERWRLPHLRPQNGRHPRLLGTQRLRPGEPTGGHLLKQEDDEAVSTRGAGRKAPARALTTGFTSANTVIMTPRAPYSRVSGAARIRSAISFCSMTTARDR